MTSRDTPRDTWLDPVAVERALTGNPVGRPLTRAELVEAARTLLARGMSPSAVQARLRLGTYRGNAILAQAGRRDDRLDG